MNDDAIRCMSNLLCMYIIVKHHILNIYRGGGNPGRPPSVWNPDLCVESRVRSLTFSEVTVTKSDGIKLWKQA